jgi:hypothetical protein
MTPFTINISDQDMLDLAAYYSYLPRVPGSDFSASVKAPLIVVTGAPMRNIAPCGLPWRFGRETRKPMAGRPAMISGESKQNAAFQSRICSNPS